jgi:formamidopyrimidine-DNA glycosylase
VLVGRRIREVNRRGKWIVLALDGGCHLVIHLGMTGQLRVLGRDEPVLGHTHLVLDLHPGQSQLRFRDVRRFGSASMIADRPGVERFFEKVGLGPEPFELNPKYWRERLAGTVRFLKAVLLDQRVIAGVGNIYADESLFEARLHPARRGRELHPREADRLRRALVKVLVRAIDRNGSTIRDYVRGSGDEGGYQNEFRVYGRTGQPCGRCGTPIHRLRMAGRSTHFCPRCQVVKPSVGGGFREITV